MPLSVVRFESGHDIGVFGVDVLAYDKYKRNFSDEYVQQVELAELQERADIISFHVPLNEETRQRRSTFAEGNFIIQKMARVNE